jgi:Zn-dependent oligopeptidase
MTEIQENIEAAVAKAAAKIAEAETVEEAQQWQSVISNLTGSLQTVQRAQVPVDVVREEDE